MTMVFTRVLVNKRKYKIWPVIILMVGWNTLLVFPSVGSSWFFKSGSHVKQESTQDNPAEQYLLHNHFPSRQLLGTLPNCTPPAIEQFPNDIFSKEQRAHGAVVVHILVSAYMFIALAIVCDDYFVPSLEHLCEALNIQTDVAGATFMAAGSSAPELATAVIAVFVAEDDIGLGAVVGSAVFNIMFVISICALFAGMVVYLQWWPLFRDCSFYALSICVLAFVILDEKVHWYESLILLLLYAVYIVLMFFNRRIEAWIVPKFTCCSFVMPEDENKLELVNSKDSHIANGAIDMEDGDDSMNPAAVRDGEEEESPLSMPQGICKKILWFISLPLIVTMYITIPDCRKNRWKKWFLLTFVMSCVWISAYSYLLVWMITVVGHTFHIPDTVMGLTLLAAGVSVPDAIASYLVVRDGLGDMAVSNAVGSNVFDILLCLGLPWFLKTAVQSPGSAVQVYSAGLTYSTLTLLTTVVLLLLVTHLNGWRMTRTYGVILMVLYILFNILAILYELNIFGYFHPPECHSDF